MMQGRSTRRDYRGNYCKNEKDKKCLIDNEKIYIVSKDKINLNELPKLSRINYETDSSLKIVLENWWQENFDAPPNITMEVDRMEFAGKWFLMVSATL